MRTSGAYKKSKTIDFFCDLKYVSSDKKMQGRTVEKAKHVANTCPIDVNCKARLQIRKDRAGGEVR
jgi:hypothetical protein